MASFRTLGTKAALGVVLLSGCGANTAVERVILPPGTPFSAVTDTLVAHRVVTGRRTFKLLARLRRVDRSVQAGIYEFEPGVSPWRVLDILASGRGVGIKFTVPEGLTIAEVAALAAARLGLPQDSMLSAARDGASATAALGFKVASFETGWEPGWNARLDSIGLSRLQLVTLASIVEGEARADDEREIIAGVYHNRLKIGMALQADPTVQYAIALATGARKTRLLEKDYQFPSPYNTYLHPGLPPGPVNSPSHRSLAASLYPAQVPFLYFVAGPDGRHVFSRTYSEHLRNVARVRKLAAAAPAR